MEGQDRGVPSLFTITLIQFFVGTLLFIALLYGQRDLTVLTLLVLGVISGARLWARMSLSGVKCHLMLDKRKVFPGEKLTLRISAENAKLLPIWLEMKVPIGSLLQRSSGERVLTKESSLLWYQRTHFEWDLTAERRGVYQIGPLHILAGDLFSFFSKHKRAEEFHSIIVYPRLVSLKSFSLPRRDFFGVPRAKSPVQDPIYILGTRDYQHGQPSKYIHWKASARHNRLQEKVFESTQQEKVLLVVNVDPFARCKAEEDFERTLEIVASLAVRLDQRGHSVGLVANGTVKGGGPAIVPVARNYQQLPAILELLARLQMKPDRDLKDLLRHRLALAWGISCVYFSHEEDETVFSAKEYFTQRKTPVTFFVCQPHLPAGEDRPEVQRKIYRLDDICTHKAETK
jgi:uncharacterized protein (DUF58 family)